MRKNNTEFQKKKNVILFIHGYACCLCGFISTSNHVHHIDRDNGNNDPFNLAVLCPYCHNAVHEARITLFLQNSPSVVTALEQLRKFF